MSKEPSLSIIMPVYREAAIIVPALQALKPLRRRGVEVIVVDGSSSDETLALARAHVDHAFTAECGRASQMNAGASAARGRILLFLHADTRLPTDADTLIDRHLAESAHAWGRFDVRIDGFALALFVIAALMNRRFRVTGISTGDQAISVTRDAFDRVGGFPGQALMEDIALCRRLRTLSPPVCLRARVVTSGRRWTHHGVLRTVVLMWGYVWLISAVSRRRGSRAGMAIPVHDDCRSSPVMLNAVDLHVAVRSML